MKLQQTTKILETWAAKMLEADKQWNDFASLTGADTDSALGNALWFLADGYSNAVAKLVGDDDGWLGWWQCENDFGRKDMRVTVHGRKYPCRTAADLAKILHKRK